VTSFPWCHFFFFPDTSHLEPVILNCLFAIITTIFIFLYVGGCIVVQFFKSVSTSVKEYCGKTCAGLVDSYSVMKNNDRSHVL